MAEPVSSVGIGTAVVKGAKWAWDHQDEIEPKLKLFYRNSKKLILGVKPGVLILGPGGAGKTTVAKILSGKYDFLLDTDGQYEQSVRVQTFRSKKNTDVELVVAPGQEDRRQATWPTLLADLSNGKHRGVILCCAYGYHSLSISYKLHKAYDKNAPKRFLQDFLADRRAEEIKILRDVGGSLQQNPNPCWLLTLVLKEDLWTADDLAVRRHYMSGEYGRAARESSSQLKVCSNSDMKSNSDRW